MREEWHHPFVRALRACAYLIAHGFICLVLLGIVSLLQWAAMMGGDPKLFDSVPLRYIFDVIDLAIIIVFLVFGTKEAIAVFREEDEHVN